jgi:response regulator NasT
MELAIGRFEEMKALEDENKDLEERLETRKVVDRAKGKLMDEFDMKENDAFRWVQRRAMDERTSMRDVAQRVLDGSLRP